MIEFIDYPRILGRLEEYAAFRKPIIMYHGTSSKFLRSIMVNGIVPKPKQKTWEIDPAAGFQDTRVSLPGSYWTSNYMTASGAAHNAMLKFGGKKIYVIAQINEQSGLADEDSIKSYIKYAFADMAKQLFPGIMTDAYGLFMSNFSTDHKKYNKAVSIFSNSLHKYLTRIGDKYSDTPIHNDKIPLDHLKLAKLFHVFIIDNIAKLKANDKFNSYIREIEKSGIIIPSPNEADNELLRCWEWLTTRYRGTAYKPEGQYGYSGHTMRNILPVGFRGHNRILAIIQENDLEKTAEGLQYHNTTKKDGKTHHVWWPFTLLYGKVPQEFIEQYTERSGKYLGAFPPGSPEIKPINSATGY
jgi:hypothetical protein